MKNTSKVISKSKEWVELLNKDIPVMDITEEARMITKKASKRFFRGSVRISTGKFWTKAEYEKFRNRVLNTPLP